MSANRATGELDAVAEQSGLFAGEGGYHVKADRVNLIGGAIVSTVEKDKNELSARELHFEDLKNKSDYQSSAVNLNASYGSAGKGTTPSATSDYQNGFEYSPLMPISNKGEDSSTTYATVSPGVITIDGKRTDVEELGIHSDASTAHRQVAELPNLQKLVEEQKAVAKATGTIMSAAEVYRKNQLREAEEAKALAKEKAEEALEARGGTEWEEYLNSESSVREAILLENKDYEKAWESAKRWERGGDDARRLSSTTALLTGILGGQTPTQATLNASAPYVAAFLGEHFGSGAADEEVTRFVGHFVLGATLAYINGANPAAGGSAAVAAEAAAQALAEQYDDGQTAIDPLTGKFNPSLLPDEAKSEIVALTGAISGLVGATADSGSLMGAQISSVIGENAAENNNFRLVMAGLKISLKVVRHFKKFKTISLQDLARFLVEEGLSIVDNIDTLTDGELNWDDALAVLDLAGLPVKEISLGVKSKSIVKSKIILSPEK